MNKYVIFFGLLFWGVFLVLIGTYGGEQGGTAAGTAAGISALLIFCYGILHSINNI